MAKVKIQGHASGTGVLTITAPNTSTDRTITLPDATGTLATTADTFDPDGAVTINDTGAAVDFRVESDNDANCLIVDGSADAIGVGIAAPLNKLHIYHATLNNVLRLESGDASAGVEFKDNNTTNLPSIYNATDDLIISTGGSERVRIKSDGKIINQSGIYQVGTQTDTNATGWNFETSSASTISCAQNTAVKIGNVTASGFIIINDTTVTGQAAVIVTGGGVISVVGQTSSQFVSSSSPSTSQVGIYNAGGYVTIKNGKSSTMGISLMTFRTRTGQ